MNLSERFKHFGVKTIHANDDAYLWQLKLLLQKREIDKWILTCEDTDVMHMLALVLSWSDWPLNIEVCIWDRIREIRKLVNTESQDYFLLAHGILGYDRNSRIYRLGKERVLKTDKMKKACAQASLVFY